MAELRFKMFLREELRMGVITAPSAPIEVVRLQVAGLERQFGRLCHDGGRRSSPRALRTLGFAGGWLVIPVAQAKAGALTRSMLWGVKAIRRYAHRRQPRQLLLLPLSARQ